MPADLATRMFKLFSGAGRSHGTYVAEEVTPGQPKHEIKRTARTVREPVTVELWREHLAGVRPLGVVPIREDNCCRWGLVDIDVYAGLDHAAIAAELAQLRVPALVLRSKSGGAHVVLFFSEPVPAGDLVPRLRDLAGLLGHGEAEVFPKQTRVLHERGDLGSWVNMPYFGDGGERCCVVVDGPSPPSAGRRLSLAEFLDAAEGSRMTAAALAALPLRRSAEGFTTGPPCLEHLAATGVAEHEGRNDALLAYGVLAKKMHPDGWEAALERWNREIMRPPLQDAEVHAVVRGLRKKDYRYRCKSTPICSHCNYGLCLTRPHGVKGVGGEVVPLESMSTLLTDPRLHFVCLKSGDVVAVTSKVLTSPREFKTAVAEMGQHMPTYPQAVWDAALSRVFENVTYVEVPRTSTLSGELEELIHSWVADQYVAERREELAAGKPWLDPSASTVLFTMRALQQQIERVKFAPSTGGLSLRGWLTHQLRQLGGETKQVWAAKRNLECWALPAGLFPWRDDAALPVPELEDAPL